MRYKFKQDDDAHWYLVPLDKEIEFDDYLREIYEYWEYPDEYEAKGLEEPQMPEGIKEIGGSLSLVSFENPRFD